MTIISSKYKYIFIHIPKTGGMTIKNTIPNDIKSYHFFFKNNTINNTFHQTIDELTVKNLNNYFIFTFVRNPYDRLYSAYLYSKNEIKKILIYLLPLLFFTKSYTILFLFNLSLINIICFYLYIDFNNFIKFIFYYMNILIPYAFKTQYDYIKDFKIDFIGRNENFNNDIKYIIKKFNLNVLIKNKNVIYKNNYKSKYKYIKYYNKKSIDFVNNFYHIDFIKFSYNKIN